MKKLRLILLFFAVLLIGTALTSCSLFSSLFGGGELTLTEINAMLDEAAPKKAKADISSVYTDPAVTLTADLELETTATAEKYTYRVDYLLSKDEALTTGEAVGEYRGHVTIEGDTVTEDSGEIDDSLLDELSSVTLVTPSFSAAYLESHTITEEDGRILFEARARDIFLAMIFDARVVGVTGLSIRIEIDAATERPTEMTLTYTSRKGAQVTAVTRYEY